MKKALIVLSLVGILAAFGAVDGNLVYGAESCDYPFLKARVEVGPSRDGQVFTFAVLGLKFTNRLKRSEIARYLGCVNHDNPFHSLTQPSVAYRPL